MTTALIPFSVNSLSAQDVFGPAVSYDAAGDGSCSVFSIDFNGDGTNDLVTVEYLTGNVPILPANADESVQSAVDYEDRGHYSWDWSIAFNNSEIGCGRGI
ncbi:MAG: hypothetical protein ABIE70_11870 [bacterium]